MSTKMTKPKSSGASALHASHADLVAALRGPHILNQMYWIYQSGRLGALKRLSKKGHPKLSLAHALLISSVDPQGTRIGVLAARTNKTKQFTGRLVQELEKRGYLVAMPDPSDGRAAIIRASAKGVQFLADTVAYKREFEALLTAAIGKKRMQALTQAVDALADFLQSRGEKISTVDDA